MAFFVVVLVLAVAFLASLAIGLTVTVSAIVDRLSGLKAPNESSSHVIGRAPRGLYRVQLPGPSEATR